MNRRTVQTLDSVRSELLAVAVIGNDDGDSRDAAERRRALSAIAWSRGIIVHGTGAQPGHYAEAIRAAEHTGRCLFVETDSDHVSAWLAILPRRVPVLSIVPPPGSGPHPVPLGECRA
jgi:hypothetical protein